MFDQQIDSGLQRRAWAAGTILTPPKRWAHTWRTERQSVPTGIGGIRMAFGGADLPPFSFLVGDVAPRSSVR